ncbi:membrane protein [Emticicia aquatilis]|uniref:Membrane protein n=1 Tax=Emticicia aquatilis TaxID=1537369 RepID=A0A917DV34_9BACT|nr:right-handed parallel beta-helix repeat-containing protein [Emticicia aquatilis]GGD70210.1 membrane protein [Emticicia aquatilis]
MKKIFICYLITLLCQIAVFGQATRTWVSGVGDDANPCSRTAPCKTFAGAISKTAAGGEISVLDPGGYGAVTITKAITINGDGTLAGILSAGTNGINVNAGVNDIVVIRNISINGTTSGLNGIRFLAGGQLHIENCSISGFTTKGIDVAKTAAGILTVENTSINGPSTAATGIYISTTSDTIKATLNNVKISNLGVGIDVVADASVSANQSAMNFVTITNSNISNNSTAIRAKNTAQINIENSNVSNNSTAIIANDVASIIRLSNVNIFNNNVFGIGNGLGKVISFGNNTIAGNAANKPMQVISKQ